MSGRFGGKVVLVAGGTGGLGRAVSLAFLGEGAEVVVTYRSEEEWAALQGPERLAGIHADVTDETAAADLVGGIVARFGRIDALVNTVGGFAGGKPLWETDARVLEQMLSLNLRAGFVLGRAAVKAMLAQRSGAIVNIASRSALEHEAGLGAYSASKAAALALMDSLAADVKGRGVRVNSVLPGIIDTEANRRAMPGADFAKWPKPEEIAEVILFLCSEQAAVIHGAAIPVYGNR
jgi:NAD(P)-dependent dehydrogenase (short-subunit alcohol dehydrogenase family)